MDINRDIMHELLQRFNSPEQLNLKSGYFGRAALHLAVEVTNLAAIEFLLERGAETDARDELQQTPLELWQHTALHDGIQCGSCGVSPLRGIRWHCRSCPDHDICDICHKAGNSPDHLFQKTSLKERMNQIATARGLPQTGLNHTYCNGDVESLVRILDLLEVESSRTGDTGVAELRDLYIE